VRYESSGVAAGVITLLLAGALIVAVVAQNSDDVPFDFLWWSLTAPLAVLLLCAVLLTLIVDQLVGAIWRRRRRHMRNLESRLS
jgi:uncharacterized integral membrane protein